MHSLIPSTLALLSAVATTVTAVPAPNPYPIPFNDLKGRVEVQAHRGGLGQRTEESLWAFAYAMVSPQRVDFNGCEGMKY